MSSSLKNESLNIDDVVELYTWHLPAYPRISQDYSNIISLLGSVSFVALRGLPSSPIRLPLLLHPLANLVLNPKKVTLWDHTTSLVSVKEAHGYPLSDSDKLWSAIAHIMRCQNKASAASFDLAADFSVLREKIDSMAEPNAIAYTLQLGAYSPYKPIQEWSFAVAIEQFMKRARTSKALRTLLWHLIVHLPAGWSMALKVQLTNAISSNMLKFSPESDENVATKPFPTLDDIYWRFRNAAFLPSEINASSSLDRWCVAQMRCYFAQNEKTSDLWSQVVTLCTPFAMRDHKITFRWSPLLHTEQMTLVDIASLLLTMRVVARNFKGQNVSVPADIIHLWKIFKPLYPGLPQDVKLAFLLSFIEVAGLTVSFDLLKEVLGHDTIILSSRKVSTAYHASVIDAGVAFIRCGLRDWETIFNQLHSVGLMWSPSPETQVGKEVASRIVSKIVNESPDIAHDLYMDTANSHFRLTSIVISSIVKSCINAGEMERAISCTADLNLSPAQIARFLSAIVHAMANGRVTSLSGNAAENLAAGLKRTAQYETFSLHRRQDWECCLQLIQANSPPSRYIKLLIIVMQRHPSFWSEPFFRSVIKSLTRQKYFGAAYHLVANLPHTYGFRIPCIRMLTEQFTLSSQPRLANLAWRLLPRNVWSTATTLERIFSLVHFQYKKPSRKLARRIPQILMTQGSVEGRVLNASLTILVRARLERMARRLLATLKATGRIKAVESTTVNVLLMGSLLPNPSTKGRRQLDNIVKRAEGLFGYDANGDTKVDPVTTNILLKGLLRWQVVGVLQIREMFDRMYLNGWSSGQLGEPAPFGSSGTVVNNGEMRRSFHRHLKPMHKMFIKALWTRGDEAGAKVIIGKLISVRRIHRSTISLASSNNQSFA